MFVQSNSVLSVKSYIKSKLQDKFSENEIKLITNELLIQRLNYSKSDLILANENHVSESDLLFFRSAVKRLLENEPFQYIIGYTEFYGLNLKTDKRALIPRPETEELVDWINGTIKADEEFTLLDICTGSGCIALACKSIFSSAKIIGSDLSKDALNLARENSRTLNLDVDFIEFDALKNNDYPLEENSFDVIVSNPPYIPNSDKNEMSENVLTFEPHLALFVENDSPIIFYEQIAENAKRYLKKDGFLFFEIHEKYGKEVINDLTEKGFTNIELKKDLQGKDRMVKAQII